MKLDFPKAFYDLLDKGCYLDFSKSGDYFSLKAYNSEAERFFYQEAKDLNHLLSGALVTLNNQERRLKASKSNYPPRKNKG